MAYTFQQAPASLEADGIRRFTEEQLREIARATAEIEKNMATKSGDNDFSGNNVFSGNNTYTGTNQFHSATIFHGPITTINEVILNTISLYHMRNNNAHVIFPRAGNGLVFNNPGYGLLLCREAYHDGHIALLVLMSSSVMVIWQSGATYETFATTTPAANKVSFARVGETWRIYTNFSTGLADSFLQLWSVQIA